MITPYIIDFKINITMTKEPNAVPAIKRNEIQIQISLIVLGIAITARQIR